MSEGNAWSKQRQQWRPALLGMIAAFAVAVVAMLWLGYRIYKASASQEPRYPYVPYLVFAVASGFISAFTGLFLWLAYRREESERNLANLEKANLLGWLALQAFMVAATLGIMPVILEYNLGVLDNWFSKVSGGLKAWREWATWRPIIFTLAGFFAMMLAFLGMVGEERENPNLRRLIYGYNTFLSAVLLLGILIVVNAIAFAYGTRPFDWSATGIYTVHERMQRLLRSLTRSVDVYVLLDPGDDLYVEMRDYLEVCKTYNREHFRVHYPFLAQSRELLRRMFERYRVRPDQSGILVVYDAEGRNAYQFLRREELRSESRFGREPVTFKGEAALASAIVTLIQGPQKPVIYFTSGAGEMTPSRFEDEERNLRRLKDRLEQQGYQVKEVDLTQREPLGGFSNQIYQALLEAEVLIIADPLALPPGYLDVIKLYMGPPAPHDFSLALTLVQAMLQGPAQLVNPVALDWFLLQQFRRGKGRLLVFTGADLDKDGAPTSSPLADFLKEYGVQVAKDLLLALPEPGRPGAFTTLDALRPYVRINPQADQELRAGLSPALIETRFGLPFWRTVEAASGSNYVVTNFLETSGPTYPLTDRLIEGDPLVHLVSLLERNPEEFRNRIRKPPHPVAVTVRERSERVPRDPFHAGVAGEGAPRLVVFGSRWLALAAGTDDVAFNIVLSSIAWLRQRSELIDVGIPPRERKTFQPGPNFEQYGTFSYLLQGSLVFGLVIFSGIGVYLVRRH